jgi:hypothetical protein
MCSYFDYEVSRMAWLAGWLAGWLAKKMIGFFMD